MPAPRKRVRVTAPPGMVAMIHERFPSATAASATKTADSIVSHSVLCGVPVTAEILRSKTSASNLKEYSAHCVGLLDRQHEQGKHRNLALLPTRRFTMYSRVVSSAPRNLRNEINDPAILAFAQLFSAKNMVQNPKPNDIIQRFRALPPAAKKLYEFDLDREAYCQRRFITDAALHTLAAAHPNTASVCCFADALSVKLRGRPRIQPVQHFFSAYYEFYRETEVPHFHSLDVVDEMLSLFSNPDFRRLAGLHYVTYAARRDRWQSRRLREGFRPPPFEIIDPAMYRIRLKPNETLTNIATQVTAKARKMSTGSLIDRVVDLTSARHSRAFNERIEANKALFNDPDAWTARK